jgi:CHASE3 domain sensor protein
MYELFDRDFFKFLMGFLVILVASFFVLFMLSKINDESNSTANVEDQTHS